MTLNRQIIPISFGQGLDTKTDPKKRMPGKPYLLENGVLDKQNRVSKRPGRRLLTSLDLDGNQVLNGDKFSTFKDELLQFNKQKLYSYSPSLERWVEKGSCVGVHVKSRQIVADTAAQADSAVNNGVGLYAWIDTDFGGHVKATLIDEASGTVLLPETTVDGGSGRFVRCLSFKNYLYLFYTRLNSLYCRRINPLSPTAFDSEVQISSTVEDIFSEGGIYDVINYQDIRMMFCHPTEGADTIKIGWIDEAPSVLTGSFAATTVSADVSLAITLIEGPQSTFYLVYHNGGTAVKCHILNIYGAALYGPITVYSTTAAITNITGFKKRDDSGVTIFWDEPDGSNPMFTDTYKNTVSSAGSAGVAAVFLKGVALNTKAFSYYDEDDEEDHAFVGLVYTSSADIQSTHFLARDDGLIVAKQQPALAATPASTTYVRLANVSQVSEGKFSYTLLNRTKVGLTGSGTRGIIRTEVDFSTLERFSTAELANNLHIAGGVLSMYDGKSVVEHGFHLYPEGLTVTNEAGAGLEAGKTYQVCALYEWLDAFGQRHRSAPSVPVTLTTAGGETNLSLKVIVPYLRLTQKTSSNSRNEVNIIVFRTEGDGEVFYRVSSNIQPEANNPASKQVTVTSGMNDATLITREILYTTGDVLENISPQACSSVTAYKDRIFLCGLETGGKLEFSKAAVSGSPMSFNPDFSLPVESAGGPVIKTEVIDDKLLVLKEGRYLVTGGDGPNDTGEGNQFFPVEHVSSDVGCLSTHAAVKTPHGLMLKTKRGFYLIDSSLRASYIGAAVEEYNSYTVTSAVLLPDKNQVRFTTSEGPCLMFDYFQNQWSTFTGYQANDAVIWRDRYVSLSSSDGLVMQEDSTYFKDGNQAYRLRVGLGWLSFAGVAGFKRIWALHLLGDYHSPHLLKVSLAYDFSDTFMTSYVFNPITHLEMSSFGDDTPFGNSEVFGGANTSYQFQAGLDYQKCQSLKVLIEELTTDATEGSHEAFSLTELSLLVGVKRGMAKLRSGQVIASSEGGLS